MKKIYTLNIAVCLLLVLLFACKKEPGLPDGLKLPTLTINRISELPFSNTEWEHVFGGMAEVTYTKGSTSITDSLDMAKLAAYGKTLELGTYDIQLRSKSTATADSFVRFTSELKGVVVDKGQALTFAGNTTDGLVTIRKDLVSDKSVPSFITPQGGKSYKMGLANGYYFIYVKGGTTGQVSFYSKAADDQITKDMTIAATNHYNLVVVTNGPSSFGVQLQKFTYNEVKVGSPTLITIKMPPAGLASAYADYIFLISDEDGKILNSVKYESSMTSIKLASKEPYSKDRVSVFMLSKPLVEGLAANIEAYMNVKRGSTWSISDLTPLPSKPYTKLPVSLKYVPAFDLMSFSTDFQGYTMKSAQDLAIHFTPATSGYNVSDGSKFFLQVENQGKAYYHFFDISKGINSLEIDPALCTTPAFSKTITLPAEGTMVAYGRKDKSFANRYFLGQKRMTGGSGVYFYPDEPFEEYYTLFTYYDRQGIYHADSYIGPAIPETTNPLNLSFEENGRTLATFQPNFTGDFDYWRAYFVSSAFKMYVSVPSAGASSKLTYPDLAALTGFSDFNTSALALRELQVFQHEGFAEDKMFYKSSISSELHGKAIYKTY